MTEPVATLIVDRPTEYLGGGAGGETYIVRIDGDLPTVWDETGGYTYDGVPLYADRPLRVDDRVWLTYDPGGERVYTFATATVAHLRANGQIGKADEHWYVIVTDVEEQP